MARNLSHGHPTSNYGRAQMSGLNSYCKLQLLTISIGAKKLLCGNVRNFSKTKNGCAHRVQHTRISLGPNFGASSSLIFKDF